jgi:hypothetical protein
MSTKVKEESTSQSSDKYKEEVQSSRFLAELLDHSTSINLDEGTKYHIKNNLGEEEKFDGYVKEYFLEGQLVGASYYDRFSGAETHWGRMTLCRH